jgi:hypothetical protein
MLIATALAEDVPIVANGHAFKRYKGTRGDLVAARRVLNNRVVPTKFYCCTFFSLNQPLAPFVLA